MGGFLAENRQKQAGLFVGLMRCLRSVEDPLSTGIVGLQDRRSECAVMCGELDVPVLKRW